jgi:molecular chaperone HtpG
LKQINKSLVKKCIELLTELSGDEDKYQIFYDNFDKNIKLGVHEEKDNNRDKLIELLRYTTSKGEMVSFEKYVSQMKESQQGIYFITGENITTLENSPFIDKLKKNDYEIIYMVDPLDEYIIQSLTKYKDYKLINVTKDDLQLSENKVEKDEYKDLCKKIKDVLGDKINSVVISEKIESQPAIVTNPMGMSANMERILKAQALASKNNNPMQNIMFSQKNLEINPEHNLIKKIDILEDNTELINIVYESALLSGGYQLDDINSFLKKMYNYMN